jgi:hypothetical protein
MRNPLHYYTTLLHFMQTIRPLSHLLYKIFILPFSSSSSFFFRAISLLSSVSLLFFFFLYIHPHPWPQLGTKPLLKFSIFRPLIFSRYSMFFCPCSQHIWRINFGHVLLKSKAKESKGKVVWLFVWAACTGIINACMRYTNMSCMIG